MERMLRNKYLIAAFVGPAFLIYLFVIPVPIIQTIIYSLTEWNVIGTAEFVGLDNYTRLLKTDPYFWKAVSNTLIFALGSFILQIPIAFILANILIHLRRFAGVFRSVYFFPCLLSATAVSLLWRFIYHPNIGLLNAALSALGLDSLTHTWLSSADTALYAVIVSVSWQWFGYHMVIFMTGASSIPGELFESARMEGASKMQMMRHITIPLIKPFIKISTVLITASSIRAFDNIYVLTNGGPNNASTVLALQMYKRAFQQMKYGYGSAISVFLMIFVVVLVLFLQKVLSSQEIEY